MKKTYDHAVIYGGKFYPANTPIEIKETAKAEKPTKKAVDKNDNRAD